MQVSYTHFYIGSFNQDITLNRVTYRHFNYGNIIDTLDNKSNREQTLNSAGCIYANGSKKLLAQKISASKSLKISIEGNSANILNDIREGYTAIIATTNKKQELAYQESSSIALNELFDKVNYIAIQKSGIDLVAFSIIPN